MPPFLQCGNMESSMLSNSLQRRIIFYRAQGSVKSRRFILPVCGEALLFPPKSPSATDSLVACCPSFSLPASLCLALSNIHLSCFRVILRNALSNRSLRGLRSKRFSQHALFCRALLLSYAFSVGLGYFSSHCSPLIPQITTRRMQYQNTRFKVAA